MKKSININDEQLSKYLLEFYQYFENGYEFENFLKPYLEKLGLDEVKVTQKSRDGGIDLTAIRLGVGDFSDADIANYYVQAKRYLPSSSISVRDIRQLKGTIPFGHKGMFITTAKFSQDAINESCNDPSKPVVLIDGKKLIESCIDNELGFVFTPMFSPIMLDIVMNKENADKKSEKNEDSVVEYVVEKLITKNDIRAKIVRVPNEIIKMLPENVSRLKVKLGECDIYDYKYNSSGKFISGVSNFFHVSELIDNLGEMNPKRTKWGFLNGIIYVEVEEND